MKPEDIRILFDSITVPIITKNHMISEALFGFTVSPDSEGIAFLIETLTNILETETESLESLQETLDSLEETYQEIRYQEILETLEPISTDDMIISMLKENTGRSFLDSGGNPKYDSEGNYIGSQYGYGRHFERNLHRIFKGEPRVSLDNSQYGLTVSINLFHFLSDILQFEPEMTAKFYLYAETRPDSESWISLAEGFLEYLEETRGETPSGIYGEGEPITVNTYNHESLLSQVIQYTYFTLDQDAYIILQIHNGCDVRGGYTKPVIFSLTTWDGTEIFNDAHLYMYSLDGEANLYTDDGYHWYYDGSSHRNGKPFTVILSDIPIYSWKDYLDHIESLEPSELGEFLLSGSYGICRDDDYDPHPFLTVYGEAYGRIGFDFYM